MRQDIATQQDTGLTAERALEKIGRWTPSAKLAGKRIVWTDRRKELGALLADLQRPGRGGWISARIGALLAHYYTPDNDELTQMAIAKDWVGALTSFPQWALEVSCNTWIASAESKRKPTPGQIAEGARHAMRHLAQIQKDVDFVEQRIAAQREAGPTPEAKERAQAAADKLKQDFAAIEAARKLDDHTALKPVQCERGAAILQSQLYAGRQKGTR